VAAPTTSSWRPLRSALRGLPTLAGATGDGLGTRLGEATMYRRYEARCRNCAKKRIDRVTC
jgi:hypothetical protein